MQKIDLRKQWKHLYKPSAKKIEIVDVPPMNFLMIDGQGDPNIPFVLAERGRTRLREAGANLVARDFPIGHWIDPQELQEARLWMEELLAGG